MKLFPYVITAHTLHERNSLLCSLRIFCIYVQTWIHACIVWAYCWFNQPSMFECLCCFQFFIFIVKLKAFKSWHTWAYMNTIFEIKTNWKLGQGINFYGVLQWGYIFFQDSSKRKKNKTINHIFHNITVVNITICFKGRIYFIIVISHY